VFLNQDGLKFGRSGEHVADLPGACDAHPLEAVVVGGHRRSKCIRIGLGAEMQREGA